MFNILQMSLQSRTQSMYKHFYSNATLTRDILVQFSTMTYTVHKLSHEACNFEFEIHQQFQYILNDIPAQPLPSAVLSKFNRITLPRAYEQYIEAIRNFKVYEDDIWVITYPKCGTTWTQESVWQIFHGIDIEGKGKEPLSLRFPFLEFQVVGASQQNEAHFEFVSKLKRPRFIKSHLPICFLPKDLWKVKPKIIYTLRESKDAAVSFYHHYYNFYKYNGTKGEFLDLFLKGLVEHGDYWDHVEQFHLLQAYYSNLKIIRFENMKHNLKDTLKDLCTFLNKFLTDAQMQHLTEHLDFHNMKVNPAINPVHLFAVVQKNRPGSDFAFVRRGEAGSYKDEMPADYIRKFDEISQKRFHALNLH